jgi:hypothetical protein
MVCLGNICINTLHKGAKDDDDDDDDDDYDNNDDNNNNNNNNNTYQKIIAGAICSRKEYGFGPQSYGTTGLHFTIHFTINFPSGRLLTGYTF